MVVKRIDKFLFSKFIIGIKLLNELNEWWGINGPKNGMKENKAVDFHKNLQKVNEERKFKRIYQMWGGSQQDINTQQVINDLRFGKL